MAREFLDWLDQPPGSSWIDVGCGTGALTGEIASTAQPSRIHGVDPSPGFIATAKHQYGDAAEFRVGDAQDLAFGDNEFDIAVSGIALNFVPDPVLAAKELRRVTKDAGVVATYLWDYAEGMQMIRIFWDVAIELDRTISHLDEATRFPLCDPDELRGVLEASGLNEVEISSLETPTTFSGFDDYWSPLLGGQGPIPSYVMSLNPSDRHRLATQLRRALPDNDGLISLTARAWAARGVS